MQVIKTNPIETSLRKQPLRAGGVKSASGFKAPVGQEGVRFGKRETLWSKFLTLFNQCRQVNQIENEQKAAEALAQDNPVPALLTKQRELETAFNRFEAELQKMTDLWKGEVQRLETMMKDEVVAHQDAQAAKQVLESKSEQDADYQKLLDGATELAGKWQEAKKARIAQEKLVDEMKEPLQRALDERNSKAAALKEFERENRELILQHNQSASMETMIALHDQIEAILNFSGEFGYLKEAVDKEYFKNQAALEINFAQNPLAKELLRINALHALNQLNEENPLSNGNNTGDTSPSDSQGES